MAVRFAVGQVVRVHLALGIWHVGRVVEIKQCLGGIVYGVRFLFRKLRMLSFCWFWGDDIHTYELGT